MNSFDKTKFLFTYVYFTGFTSVAKIREILWTACVQRKSWTALDEFDFWSRVEGTYSRVEGKWSRVKGRGSKNYWVSAPKVQYSAVIRIPGPEILIIEPQSPIRILSLIYYFLISPIQKFTGSCLLEFPAFGSYFCLSKTFTFPRTLWHAEHQTLAFSISTVNFFFSGPRIRIIAEDKVRIADCG